MTYILAILAGIAALGGGAYAGLLLTRANRRRIHFPDPATLIQPLPVEAAVTRHDDDTLEIRWIPAGRPVRVYAGPSPDAIDYTHILAETHDDHALITALDPMQRWYFALTFGDPPGQHLITAERVLPLASVKNFRDIGGYTTRDQRQVRWGYVYRAGALSQLSGDDVAYINHLGLKIVCDLRSMDEVAAEPDRLPHSHIHYLHEPVYAGENSRERLRAIVFNPRRLPGMMLETYTDHILEFNAPFFGDLLRRIADESNLPIVIHCTAGKDRTGVTIALLLSLLGVPDAAIIADYSQSNHYYAHFHAVVQPLIKRIAWMGVTADDLKPLLTAHPDTMRATLAYIRERYGSAEGYLRDKAGLDDDVIAALKANLLT